MEGIQRIVTHRVVCVAQPMFGDDGKRVRFLVQFFDRDELSLRFGVFSCSVSSMTAMLRRNEVSVGHIISVRGVLSYTDDTMLTQKLCVSDPRLHVLECVKKMSLEEMKPVPWSHYPQDVGLHAAFVTMTKERVSIFGVVVDVNLVQNKKDAEKHDLIVGVTSRKFPWFRARVVFTSFNECWSSWIRESLGNASSQSVCISHCSMVMCSCFQDQPQVTFYPSHVISQVFVGHRMELPVLDTRFAAPPPRARAYELVDPWKRAQPLPRGTKILDALKSVSMLVFQETKKHPVQVCSCKLFRWACSKCHRQFPEASLRAKLLSNTSLSVDLAEFTEECSCGPNATFVFTPAILVRIYVAEKGGWFDFVSNSVGWILHPKRGFLRYETEGDRSGLGDKLMQLLGISIDSTHDSIARRMDRYVLKHLKFPIIFTARFQQGVSDERPVITHWACTDEKDVVCDEDLPPFGISDDPTSPMFLPRV